MNRRYVIGTMVMAAALFSAQSVYAAPAANLVPLHTVSSKSRLVKFTLRNDSHATVTVKAGDTEMSLEPGKPVKVTLPEGQQIIALQATAAGPAGSVVATVSQQYGGNTVVLQ
jgi:hypothetical protein